MKMLSSKRRGKMPTRQSLEGAALYYLSRYAASEFSLRRVLANRLRRAARHNPLFAKDEDLQKQLQAAIESIVEKHRKTGILNDASYAELKMSAWRRAGRSARAIRQRLGRSGVATDIIDQTLDREGDSENENDAEYRAALTLARRCKLGPFRKKAADDGRRHKDLAALARAGFSLAVARRVLKTQADARDETA